MYQNFIIPYLSEA